MRTRVKICGITRVEDARAAVRAGADALGFVLWPGSPRTVTIARARRIARTLPPFVARVGVFVDASPTVVRRAVRAIGLTAIQLHGDETAATYRRCGVSIIKAVSLADRGDVARALRLPADVLLLVDARDPVRRGGTGRLADWSLAASVARRRPILLAGGLQQANVKAAIGAVQPWGIDVSSGVEHRPGVKSPAKLAALFRAVARADREVS